MKFSREKLIVGKSVYFQYKRGKVEGEVIRVGDKFCVIKLSSPYQGRNEFWGTGELKVCSINEMEY